MDLKQALAVWLIFGAGFVAAASAVVMAFVIKEALRLGVGRSRWSRHDAGREGSCRGCDGSRLRRF
jgi:hypothetical protein